MGWASETLELSLFGREGRHTGSGLPGPTPEVCYPEKQVREEKRWFEALGALESRGAWTSEWTSGLQGA